MAFGENKIHVVVDPNGEPKATSGQDSSLAGNTSGENIKDKNDTANKVVTGAVLLTSAIQLGQATIGQAGAITGDSQLQKKATAISGLVVFGALANKTPQLAVVLGLTSVVKSTGTQLIQARNDNQEATYNNSVRGNAYNNGRIVGGI